ncbi:MAG TPA: protein-disulfide reductase DsbD domain-containing protein [Alphaproteobacteria bacterium]|nr:protein-disulfide reductase DsbD domain-containing protein [Alphaproteobacteria bacterium]
MKRLLPVLLLLLALALPEQAHALASDWQKDDDVAVRLITGMDGVGQEKSIPLGLEIQMSPGWHTYWRTPGAAGLPPHIDWQNTMTDDGNMQDAKLLYPAPKRYTAYGLETVGYRDHVVLPIDATLRAQGKPLVIGASVDLLVCSAICVPKTYNIALTVPAGDAKESADAGLIKQYRDQLPGNAEQSGLILKSVISDGKSLLITVESREILQAPDIFIEDDKNIGFDAPITKLANDNHSVKFRVPLADTLPDGMALAGMPLVMTVTDGDHALEQHIVAPPITTEAPNVTPPPMPLTLAILFAILGGFILNLMPCVLPVLSMKILSVVSHGGGDARTVRHSFLITAAGILFSFLVLAMMTIGLKAFGLTLGWGVQFQQPIFLGCLILLLTLFAANMWTLFEIRLPAWLADNLSDASYHPKLAGDFATGAFATILATPCTAPFLGTAVGFALASGPLDILVIFMALGFGMIIPYLAIALFPSLATKLPKPGAWMVRLRHLLGLALAATALWLIWVLSAQITAKFATLVGLSMLGIVILLSLRKTSVSQKLIKIGLIDFGLVALVLIIAGSIIPKPLTKVDALWLPFDEHAIAADVDEGKVVFVDVTADWCLTCKANKKFILSRDDLSQKLFHSDVLAMQADWTNPDPVITAFLHKYGRYGIPFNAVFGPGAPQGLVLPELLSPEAIEQALEKAAKPPQP